MKREPYDFSRGRFRMVDYDTKEYLQQKGFLPIGVKDRKWVFHKTETLINILQNYEKGGKE